ncbi:MAG: hypothetical protein ACAF41_12475 [Leptolyngbya sp. BL-A-14]
MAKRWWILRKQHPGIDACTLALQCSLTRQGDHDTAPDGFAIGGCSIAHKEAVDARSLDRDRTVVLVIAAAR